MQKTMFMDKYPVYSLRLEKNEVAYKNVPEIVAYFKEKIEDHEIAKFITVFDHYTHTSELNGTIPEGLRDAQNVVFCFGKEIPNTKILAVRPRSIGICEFDDYFVIDFIEAPKEKLHAQMESWTKGLVK